MHESVTLRSAVSPRPLHLPLPLVAGGTLALAAVAALPFDLPIAISCRQGELPGDLEKIIVLSEVFAHGYGVLLIGLAMALLDPVRRPQLLRVYCCAFGAGLVTGLIKCCVARTRPLNFSFEGDVFATFLGWFPLLDPELANRAFQSFPSGHAATAFGFAIGLSSVYPRGRWLFFLLAVLASTQRVIFLAHYASDVLFAAAIGCVFPYYCVYGGPLARWLNRWERYASGLAPTK